MRSIRKRCMGKIGKGIITNESRKAFASQDSFAERQGFEPREPLSSTVFKTAAIDHSATFPRNRQCDLGGARTLDPMIKSHLLYQLSYQVIMLFFVMSDLGGARTLDPMIKSHLLYQLSYQVILFRYRYFFKPPFVSRLRVQR